MLIGLALAVFSYFASIRRPDVTYYLHPIRTVVVARNSASKLEVRYNGNEIAGDVCALQFAIWNSGKEPVRGSDILEAVTLKPHANARILEYTVTRESRSVSKFRARTARADPTALDFGWDILENGDGAVVQILYEGSSNARFSVTGSVVGQRLLRNASADGRAVETKPRRATEWVTTVAFTTVFLFVTISTIRDFKRLAIKHAANRQAKLVGWAVNSFLLCFFSAGFVLGLVVIFFRTTAPFEF
jgi:hypothetical protein